MAGPTKRGNIWYYRKAIPKDLIEQREKLSAIGIDMKGREVWISLKIEARREADIRYREVANQQERLWDSYRSLLQDGFVSLTEKNQLALAASVGREFWERHEENPSNASGPRMMIAVLADNLTLHHRGNLKAIDAIQRLKHRFSDLPPWELFERLSELDTDKLASPELEFVDAAIDSIEHYYETVSWVRARHEMKGRGFKITKAQLETLSLQVKRYRKLADERLKQNTLGNYETPQWDTGAPEFKLRSKQSRIAHKIISFASIIEMREAKNLKKLGTAIAPNTFKKYRRICGEFVAWRGDDNVLTASKAQLAEWIDVLGENDLGPKTIRDKARAITGVIGWGINFPELEVFTEGNPLSGIDLPRLDSVDSIDKTYTREQAMALMEAARQQDSTWLRWMPSLFSYTGMRIGEAHQLTKADVESYRNNWYIRIRHDESHTTKSKSPRVIPVHSKLIEEGFIDFIGGLTSGDSKLFDKPRAAQQYRDWVRDVVFVGQDFKPAPAHGLRHLFIDLMRSCLVNERIGRFMTGHKENSSSDDYGKSRELWSRLTEEIEKIEL